MANFIKPRPWHEVYPQGSLEGDKEQKFFIALSRHKKYKWRSFAALVRESGLTEDQVKAIIEKYAKLNIVIHDPDNDDQYGYWERVPDAVPKSDSDSIAKKDQDKRMSAFVDDETF